MNFIAFVGATRYEFQLGKVWLTVLRPRYWCWRAWPGYIKVGIDEDIQEEIKAEWAEIIKKDFS